MDTTQAHWPSRTAGAFHSRLQIEGANAIQRRLVADAVHFRREDARRFYTAMLDGLRLGMACNAGGLTEIALHLSDAMSDLIGGMEKDLDNAGLDTDAAKIDTAELDALIAKMRAA